MSSSNLDVEDTSTSENTRLKYNYSSAEPNAADEAFAATGQAFYKEKPWYKRARSCVIAVGVVVIVLVGIWIGYATKNHDDSNSGPTAASLVNAMSVDNIHEHLLTLNNIASLPRNKGSRAIQLGYNDSAHYVMDVLAQRTNLLVSTQPFFLPVSFEEVPPTMTVISPDPAKYTLSQLVWGVDFVTLMYSGAVIIDKGTPVTPILGGCTLAEFNSSRFTTGDIVLLDKRNTTLPGCSFGIKLELAFALGAGAALVYDSWGASGTPTALPIPSPTAGRLTVGSLASKNGVFGLTPAVASQILKISESGQAVHVTLFSSRNTRNYTTFNVIAETPGGRDDAVIVVGTHLDSVEAGPGINDNGSGSSMNLELAVEFANVFPTGTFTNKVRFCWWAAEEVGLVGSSYYVNSLSVADRARIALNLNFDMLASPNFMRGVYDAASAVQYPWVQNSSALLQQMFYKHFTASNIMFKPVPFTGRSDYWAFIQNGIPAGGLDTGAEVVKTVGERDTFGGIANIAYDPCYHQYCDSLGNANMVVLRELAHAAADVLGQLATTVDLPGFLGPRVLPPSLLNVQASAAPSDAVDNAQWYPTGVSIPDEFDLRS